MIKQIIYLVFTLLIIPGVSFSLPAFPGAEGMGASSTGARGYSGTATVYKVTNLNDSGTGSLRNGLEGTGKDGTYITFEVSGTISLSSDLEIHSSYITIAGETSPGGICVSGYPVEVGNSSDYNYHDIIIRHMRFRCGSYQCEPNCDTEESFRIWKSYDIILDHCSFSWGVDETISVTTYTNDSAYNITISWCMITQGLDDPAPEAEHGFGMFFNGSYSTGNTFSMHHNYIAHNSARSPQLSGPGTYDLRNNVIYNWRSNMSSMFWPYAIGESHMNYISNYSKTGVDSSSCVVENSYNVKASGDGPSFGLDDSSISPYDAIYMVGNFGCRRDEGSDPEWQVSNGNTGDLLSLDWKKDTAFTTTDISITTSEMTESYAEEILETVGATKPVRDSYDTEMVNDFLNDTGSIIGNIVYPDDYPVFSTPTPPTDTNSNGIADDWEIETFGELVSATDDNLANGYNNIEDYLHYLAGDAAPTTPTINASFNCSIGTE